MLTPVTVHNIQYGIYYQTKPTNQFSPNLLPFNFGSNLPPMDTPQCLIFTVPTVITVIRYSGA